MIENEIENDNQIDDNDADYDILGYDNDNEIEEVDEVEAEEEEIEENEGSDQVETIEEVEVVDLLDDMEVKYLHENKKLKDIPRDELRTLVQKGMNHDRLVEKVESYKALEGKMSDFEEIASLHGMTADELKESMLNSYFENKAYEDGVTPELLKREHAQNKKEKSASAAAKEESDKAKAMSAFVDKYPNVKGDDIDNDTWDLINNGMNITQAYEKQISNKEVATLRAKVAELEGKRKTNTQNAEVKKKAVVKSTTANGSDDPDKNDDFLSGLFGK